MTEIELLRKTYTDQLKSLSDAITSGRCADWAEYRETCGKIRGLSFALDELNALADRLRREDDE
jgi:hypothetical protein